MSEESGCEFQRLWRIESALPDGFQILNGAQVSPTVAPTEASVGFRALDDGHRQRRPPMTMEAVSSPPRYKPWRPILCEHSRPRQVNLKQEFMTSANRVRHPLRGCCWTSGEITHTGDFKVTPGRLSP
jgi:hypothetical protein